MKKEELKNLFLTHLNLDSYRRMEMERFLLEYPEDDIDPENFNKLLSMWRESAAGQDAKILVGLTSAGRGDYHIFRPDRPARSGAYVIEDNVTKLRGLASGDNDRIEIMPCIFDLINIKLSSPFIEAHFKGRYYEFSIRSMTYVPEEYEIVFNGGIWLYELRVFDSRDSSKIYDPKCPDETTQQLIDLLNVKHSTK